MEDSRTNQSTEAQLEESRLRLARHMENTPLGCISWDLDFKCTEWNRAAERMFGYTPDEAIGRHATELVIPEIIHDQINGIYAQLLSQAGGSRSTNENVRKDGRIIVCDWYNTPIVDAAGEVLGVASLIQDITERIRSDLDSKRTTALLEYSQQAAKVGGWELNIETGQLYWTAETYRLHDTSPDEFNPTLDAGVGYYLPESKATITEALARAMEEGIGYELELDTFTAKGRLISVYTTCKVSLKEGKPHLLTGIFQDITEVKRAADSLQREQLRLESILRTAADGIVIINDSGTIISINQAAENMFRLHANEAVGQNVSILMPETDSVKHDGYLNNYIETGIAKLIGSTRDLTARRSDGTEFPMQLSLSEWFHGDERFFTGMIRDITDQREVMAQLIQSQKIESLAQLSGGLAHDFNNLLAIVIGNLDILEGDLDLEPDSRERLMSAIHAAERGADITQRMLKLARTNENGGTTSKAQNINELLAEMVTLLRRTLGPTYNIALNLGGSPILVKVDPSEFENVILNLCVNARDAMPNGGDISIETSIETSPETTPETTMVRISVSDNGTGMSPEVLQRVFEPFFSTKTGKGSGLGLAMAYSFANSCNGDVRADSEEGVGTTIHLSLPVTEESDLEQSTTADKEMPEGSDTILLVDDEPDLLVVTEKILKDLGYHVITSPDARSAQAILEGAEKIDLLLTDVVMPGGMLGTELATQALRANPGLNVLLMSGYNDGHDSLAGMNDSSALMLQKPFRKADLASSVKRSLSKKTL